MANILKLNKISPVAGKYLGNHKLLDECENPDAIIVRSFKMLDYPLGDNLLCVARAGAGVNNIPVDKCAEKGIVVFNTPGANANAVKELVLCALFMCGRKIVQGIEWAKGLSGDDITKQVEDGKKAFVGHEIMGKTLGVIGLGAIGAKVAQCAVALGMKVIGCDPFYKSKIGLLDESIELTDDYDYVYKNSDFITIHTPLMDSTKGMINKNAIAKMKDGVNLINYARGELVVTADVVEAVKSGKINRYLNDFPCAEFAGEPNIVATPHLGASTPEAEDNCAEMAAKQMADYIENGNIVNSVNFPRLVKERKGKNRYCVIAKGACAGDILKNVGFTDVECAVKGDYSYAIADCDCDKEKKIDAAGVIRCRIIK